LLMIILKKKSVYIIKSNFQKTERLPPPPKKDVEY
jgi:hypothetical protein